MNRNILITSLLVASSSLFAQDKLAVSHLSVERKAERVVVTFRATSEAVKPKVNNTYTYTPTMVNGVHRLSLKPIVMGSRRARLLNQRRGMNMAEFYQKGDTLRYHAETTYAEWMTEAELQLQQSVEGCCTNEMGSTTLLASTILPSPPALVATTQPEPPAETPVVITPLPIEVAPAVQASTGKRMAERYAFIAPLSTLADASGTPLLDLTQPLPMGKASDEEQQRKMEEYLTQNEASSLKIHFAIGSSDIDRTYLTNKQSVRELIEAIHTIHSSADSEVAHIVVAGFASPDGSLTVNDRLAWRRALALRNYLVQHTQVKEAQIHLYNGSENWMGLRRLVAQSDMKHREEVLRIIDEVPLLKGREKQLMDLAGGVPYRYVLKHLFPQLRHAAYIRIYYKEKAVTTK